MLQWNYYMQLPGLSNACKSESERIAYRQMEGKRVLE